jgi:hypothetical protein
MAAMAYQERSSPMSNINKQAVTAKTKELSSLMVERFSMNPVSCKLLNEAWKKEFPDEVAIAKRMLALLDALEAAEKRNAELMEKQRLIDICQGQGLEHRIAAEKRAEAAEKRIAVLTAERDALREGEMGDAKHSNTRAAADIYFQLVEECDIPPGGSLVGFVDALKARIAELEAREVKLSKLSVDEVMHLSGFSRDYAEGWCAGNDNARHEIQVAGIRLGGLR